MLARKAIRSNEKLLNLLQQLQWMSPSADSVRSMGTVEKLDEKLYNDKREVSVDKYMNEVSKRRPPCVFRELHNLSEKLEVPPINMCGGFPHHSTFPIQSATFNLNDGSSIRIPPEQMQNALQYSSGYGYEPLHEKVKELVYEMHQPPSWEDRETLIVSGAQEALGKIADLIIDEGDGVILPEQCYTTFVATLSPLRPKILSVPYDEHGMVIEKLEDLIEECQGTNRIKMLYVVPTGSNPTGITTSLERREQIYELACKHDFLIVEDDPYYFLNMSDEELPPSFLNLDTNMRVLRIDSVSKCFGPGLRVGWVTAPEPFIPRIQRHIYTHSMQPSGLSQVALSGLFNQWGEQGFENYFLNLKSFYKTQRAGMIEAANKHLTGLAEWKVPSAGMFLWMKILGVEDSYDLIHKDLLEAGVMLCSGNSFFADPSQPSPYVRCSFAYRLPEDFDKGFEILAKVIREKVK